MQVQQLLFNVLTLGQSKAAASAPVVIASDQPPVAMSDTQSAPVSGVVPLVAGAGAQVTPGRMFLANVIKAGAITLTFADGSTLTQALAVGFTAFPYAVTGYIVPAGSNFAGQCYNGK